MDGITHINVYSGGKTELGRWLSNFTKAPFQLVTDGSFDSVEGYWYWLQLSGVEGREGLRKLSGISAKKLGQKLREGVEVTYDDEFKTKIKTAIAMKILTYPNMFDKFIESTLPFTHYYDFGGRIVEAGHQWQVDFLDRLRYVFSLNSQ